MVGPEVELGDGCELMSHVVSPGARRSAPARRIFPFASIGHIPQDLKYRGEPSTLDDRRRLHDPRRRHHESRHRRRRPAARSIGDRCAFLANSHVGARHARSATTSSCPTTSCWPAMCTVGDFVIFGGGAAVHPVRTRRLARLRRRHVGARERPHPLRHGDRQPRASGRPQHHRLAPARLHPRADPRHPPRLSPALCG